MGYDFHKYEPWFQLPAYLNVKKRQETHTYFAILQTIQYIKFHNALFDALTLIRKVKTAPMKYGSTT